jgi:trans-aconitate methyltransferase
MKLYTELAWLWSELTPVGTYIDEAQDLFDIVTDALGYPPKNILELGAGGGYLLHDLQTLYPEVEVTLVDLNADMLQEAKQRNPRAKLVHGDMTNLDLSEQFDFVLLHDAVMYLPNRDAVSAVLKVMHRYVSEQGVAVIVPDVCKETFEERILTADSFAENVRVHITEWHWDPVEDDYHISVAFSVLCKKSCDVEVTSHCETHQMIVLPLSDWMTLFTEHGWAQDFPSLPWMHGGEFFLLRPDLSQ